MRGVLQRASEVHAPDMSQTRQIELPLPSTRPGSLGAQLCALGVTRGRRPPLCLAGCLWPSGRPKLVQVRFQHSREDGNVNQRLVNLL